MACPLSVLLEPLAVAEGEAEPELDAEPPLCGEPSALDSLALMILGSGLAVMPVPFAQDEASGFAVLEKVMSAH